MTEALGGLRILTGLSLGVRCLSSMWHSSVDQTSWKTSVLRNPERRYSQLLAAPIYAKGDQPS